MPDASHSRLSAANRSTLPALAVAAAAIVIGWFILSHSTRPVEELVATVEATTSRPQTDSQTPPDRTAMIRMPDGRLVQARIIAHDPVQAGQRAHIVVIEDLLSGQRTYELTDVVAAK